MFNSWQNRDLNPVPCGWKAEILPVRQPRRRVTFHAICLATPLRNELHEPLQRVTPREMAKIVARQVVDIVARNKIHHCTV